MEFESIQKIVEAEKEAENIKQDAKQKAKMILERAENSKESIYLYYKAQLESKEKELKKEQAEENERKISKIQAETTEKLQNLKGTLERNVEQAVDKIFAKIINI